MATSSKPRVYIETSVVSYLTALPSRDLVMAANQQITQEWNCKHIANAELVGRIRSTVESYGCGCPTICVPSELMGEAHDEQ